MFHRYLVNQSITEECRVKVHLVQDEYLNWTYENVLGPTGQKDTPIFPISLYDDKIPITPRQSGRETSCRRISDGTIIFRDDYSVPEGFLICVTGPVGYEPHIIRLNNKPTLEGDDFNNVIPTHFELKSNRIVNQASVLMHVLRSACFGIEIEFKKVDGIVSRFSGIWYHDPFDLSLSSYKGKLNIIDRKTVEHLNPGVDDELLSEICILINQLIEEINLLGEEAGNDSIPADLRGKITNAFTVILGTGSSLITLLDSYKNNGVVGELFGTLVKLVG